MTDRAHGHWSLLILLLLSLPLLPCSSPLWGEEMQGGPPKSVSSEGVVFFEKKILPVLTRYCYECHSRMSDEPQGGLQVDTRAAIRAGGGTGPGIVPGDPDTSLVIEAVRYEEDAYQMPPAGKLSDEIIRDLEQWVRMGAPDPRDEPTPP